MLSLRSISRESHMWLPTVVLRASSFGTEVPQDDSWRGKLFKLSHHRVFRAMCMDECHVTRLTPKAKFASALKPGYHHFRRKHLISVDFGEHFRVTGGALKNWFIAQLQDSLAVGLLWLIGLLVIGVPL